MNNQHQPINASGSHNARHMLDGIARVFLADALILPTGILTVAFLTRRLGSDGFGSFAIVSAIVVWIEASINTIFYRATLKFVAEAKDRRLVGTTIVRLHLSMSLVATFLLWLLSPLIGKLLHEEILVPYLWLFSLDIPIAGLTDSHRNLLVGIGSFRQRALSSAARWIGRLLLIVALVELGFSVPGAILGNIGASLIELTIARVYIRPSLLRVTKVNLPDFWYYVWPLVLFSISVSLFTKLDLLALKMLGRTANDVGIYSAAQSLAVVPGIFAMSFSPLLLSTLSRLISAGDMSHAKDFSLDAMRLVILLLPFAGMTAGMSHEIVDFVFGPSFRPAAPVLSLLIFGALGMAMISVVTAILTAAGKPKWALVQGAFLLPVALVGHILLIPRLGLIGASTVTTFCATLGALGSTLAVYRVWKIFPSVPTLARASLLYVMAFVLASAWPASSALLFFKIFAISILISSSFMALREFSPEEIALLRSLMHWKSSIRLYSN